MSLNSFFKSNFNATNEHRLFSDLIRESIQIHGRDMFYVPRELVALDKLYGEDKLSAFTKAYKLEFYVDSVNHFDGDRDFISKFGLEIRDDLRLTVHCDRFNVEVSTQQPEIIRPREGDLIFFPLDKTLFEITFVENHQVFYQIGQLFTFALTLKRFEFAAESFDTGITGIDKIEDLLPDTTLEFVSGTGDFSVGEMVFQGVDLLTSTASAEVVAWVPSTMKLVVIRIKGTFLDTLPVKGDASGANWTFTPGGIEALTNTAFPLFQDNQTLQTESDVALDDTEGNPYSN